LKKSLLPHLARQKGKHLREKRKRWKDKRKVGAKGEKSEAKKGAEV